MENFFILLIFVSGIINIIRLGVFMTLGDWYEVFKRKKLSEKYTRKSRYVPLVSVIVAAFNEEKNILQTLRSLLKSTYKHLEIIVVDDGSTDGTAEAVKRFIKSRKSKYIFLLQQTNSGKARALNFGIKTKACGQLIMTIDADSLIAKNGIERSVAYFRNPRIQATASNVRILKTRSLLGLVQYVEYLLGYRLKRAYSMMSMEYIIGGIGSMFRKSMLHKVRYYDTDTITEDIDLTMKIIRKGNKKNQVIYADDVLTFTQPVGTVPDLLKQRFRWKYGRFQTLFKNLDMMFSRNSNHTKQLTYIQLPFVFYSEFTFLLEPLLLGFLVYVSYIFQDLTSLQWVIGFYAFFTSVTVVSDRHLNKEEKVLLITLSPLSYVFFFIISIVEYVALIKCIIGYNGIINARKIDICSWDHVDRGKVFVYSK